MSELPVDDNYKAALGLYDASGHQVVAAQAGTVVTDSTTNIKYAAFQIGSAATADSAAQTGFSEVVIGLYNTSGNVIDRLRDAGSLGDGFTIGFIGAAQMLFNGGSFDRLRTPTRFVTIAAQAVTAGTPVAVWTPAGGKKFHLMGWNVSLSVAGSIIFKDGAGTEIFRTSLMAAGVGITSPANLGNGYAGTVASQALYMDVTTTGTITGFTFGTEEF